MIRGWQFFFCCLMLNWVLTGCVSNPEITATQSVHTPMYKPVDFNLYSDNSTKQETAKNNVTISLFKPNKTPASETAVIIFPGGGYRQVVIEKEGFQIANQLNQMGITAFVVNYRLPDDTYSKNNSSIALKDAQQAIHFVRSRAEQFNLSPNKIGVMGFSAGGHLASTAANRFNHTINSNLSGQNVRPDFQALIYPVISMKRDITHPGSRERLLGKNPADAKVALYSNETQVTQSTPKAFIVHAVDDMKVPVENALRYTQALANNQIQTQLILLDNGGHGFALKHNFDWMQSFRIWLKNNQFLSN